MKHNKITITSTELQQVKCIQMRPTSTCYIAAMQQCMHQKLTQLSECDKGIPADLLRNEIYIPLALNLHSTLSRNTRKGTHTGCIIYNCILRCKTVGYLSQEQYSTLLFFAKKIGDC